MISEHTEKATILVVDDTPTNLNVLIDYLNEAGFKTLIAESGERALYQISYIQPDLILMDVMMPGLDGFETCRRLKENEDTCGIPVIFMTALSETADKIKGFEAGGVDYITKPFQREEVLARITTHVTNCNLKRLVEAHNAELQEALAKVKLLSGLLPICSHCKKIRNDEHYWQDVAEYVHEHSEADFSHGICPDCMQELYPEFNEISRKRRQDILDALNKLGKANVREISTTVGLPESNTFNRLQDMVRRGQVKCLRADGQEFYELQ